DQDLPAHIVDEVPLNVLQRAEHHQPRTTRMTCDLLPHPTVPPRTAHPPLLCILYDRHRSDPPRLLRARLAGLPPDLFTLIPDPLALVRLRRTHRPNLRGRLPDPLLVHTLDHDHRRTRRRDRDTLGFRILHRVRITHVQHQHVPLLLRPVPDPDQLQRLPEALDRAVHHVREQRPRQTVERPVRLRVRLPLHHDPPVVHPDRDLRTEGPLQLALRTLHPYRRPVDRDRHPGRNRDRLLPNARHRSSRLPDQGHHFAANVPRPGLPVRHQALRRRHNSDPQPVAYPRQRLRPRVDSQARPRYTLQIPDHRTPVVILQVDAEHPVTPVVEVLVIVDEVILLEDPGNLGLHLRHRHVDPTMPRMTRIAQPRQHVGDRIGHHRFCVSYSIRLPAGLVGIDSVPTAPAPRAVPAAQ